MLLLPSRMRASRFRTPGGNSRRPLRIHDHPALTTAAADACRQRPRRARAALPPCRADAWIRPTLARRSVLGGASPSLSKLQEPPASPALHGSPHKAHGPPRLQARTMLLHRRTADFHFDHRLLVRNLIISTSLILRRGVTSAPCTDVLTSRSSQTSRSRSYSNSKTAVPNVEETQHRQAHIQGIRPWPHVPSPSIADPLHLLQPPITL